MEEFTPMKLRRRRGATLGLVAVVVLVIAILGFGFFFLSKIMGGGREVANATDAGALNVAKRALMEPSTTVAVNSEFDGLGVDKTTGVPNQGREFNLLAYNRAVGRAMLIALNARAIGPASTQLANEVVNELENLGQGLQGQLNGGGQLPSYFQNIAGSQNVKMMGPGSNVQLSGAINCAWMVPADPANAKSNVYIDPKTVEQIGQDGELLNHSVSSGKIQSKGGWPQGFFTSSSGKAFLRAYDSNMVIGSLSKPIIGAAVGPQDRPHLVNLGEFTSRTNPVGYAPPNSWRTNSQSREMKSGNLGGAVACAIVGSLNAEYEACIPRGYIKIKNFDSAEVVTGDSPSYNDVDGSNSIFNKEFWAGTGGTGPTFYSNNGTFFVEDASSANGKVLADWGAYNASYPCPATNPNKDGLDRDGSLDPLGAPGTTPGKNMSDRVPPIRTGSGLNNYATVAECLTITNGIGQCSTNDFGATTTNVVCENNVGTMASNFGDGLNSSAGGSGGSQGSTGQEWLKSKVIDSFASGNRCTGQLNAPGKTGMKMKGNGPYNTNTVKVKFMTVGSPMALLQDIGSTAGGSCAVTDMVDRVWQRCREIHPGAKRNDVVDVLGSVDLPPGQTLYLYYDIAQGKFVMKNGLPGQNDTNPGARNPEGAGTVPACNSKLDNQINDYSVNSKDNKAGNPTGDTGIHDQPYTDFDGTPFTSQNTVEWKPSCGRYNFLGQLEFSNNTEGGGNFCKPN